MSVATNLTITDGSDIWYLECLEYSASVRKHVHRPDGPRGLHWVYEVVDNAVDEALAGYCDEIKVGSIRQLDLGRRQRARYPDRQAPRKRRSPPSRWCSPSCTQAVSSAARAAIRCPAGLHGGRLRRERAVFPRGSAGARGQGISSASTTARRPRSCAKFTHEARQRHDRNVLTDPEIHRDHRTISTLGEIKS